MKNLEDKYPINTFSPETRKEIIELFKSELMKAFTEGAEIMAEITNDITELKAPMGVSEWKKHGKKYGYWDYFNKKTEEGTREKVIEHIAFNEGWEETEDKYRKHFGLEQKYNKPTT